MLILTITSRENENAGEAGATPGHDYSLYLSCMETSNNSHDDASDVVASAFNPRAVQNDGEVVDMTWISSSPSPAKSFEVVLKTEPKTTSSASDTAPTHNVLSTASSLDKTTATPTICIDLSASPSSNRSSEIAAVTGLQPQTFTPSCVLSPLDEAISSKSSALINMPDKRALRPGTSAVSAVLTPGSIKVRAEKLKPLLVASRNQNPMTATPFSPDVTLGGADVPLTASNPSTTAATTAATVLCENTCIDDTLTLPTATTLACLVVPSSTARDDGKVVPPPSSNGVATAHRVTFQESSVPSASVKFPLTPYFPAGTFAIPTAFAHTDEAHAPTSTTMTTAQPCMLVGRTGAASGEVSSPPRHVSAMAKFSDPFDASSSLVPATISIATSTVCNITSRETQPPSSPGASTLDTFTTPAAVPGDRKKDEENDQDGLNDDYGGDLNEYLDRLEKRGKYCYEFFKRDSPESENLAEDTPEQTTPPTKRRAVTIAETERRADRSVRRIQRQKEELQILLDRGFTLTNKAVMNEFGITNVHIKRTERKVDSVNKGVSDNNKLLSFLCNEFVGLSESLKEQGLVHNSEDKFPTFLADMLIQNGFKGGSKEEIEEGLFNGCSKHIDEVLRLLEQQNNMASFDNTAAGAPTPTVEGQEVAQSKRFGSATVGFPAVAVDSGIADIGIAGEDGHVKGTSEGIPSIENPVKRRIRFDLPAADSAAEPHPSDMNSNTAPAVSAPVAESDENYGVDTGTSVALSVTNCSGLVSRSANQPRENNIGSEKKRAQNSVEADPAYRRMLKKDVEPLIMSSYWKARTEGNILLGNLLKSADTAGKIFELRRFILQDERVIGNMNKALLTKQTATRKAAISSFSAFYALLMNAPSTKHAREAIDIPVEALITLCDSSSTKIIPDAAYGCLQLLVELATKHAYDKVPRKILTVFLGLTPDKQKSARLMSRIPKSLVVFVRDGDMVSVKPDALAELETNLTKATRLCVSHEKQPVRDVGAELFCIMENRPEFRHLAEAVYNDFDRPRDKDLRKRLDIAKEEYAK